MSRDGASATSMLGQDVPKSGKTVNENEEEMPFCLSFPLLSLAGAAHGISTSPLISSHTSGKEAKVIFPGPYPSLSFPFHFQ